MRQTQAHLARRWQSARRSVFPLLQGYTAFMNKAFRQALRHAILAMSCLGGLMPALAYQVLEVRLPRGDAEKPVFLRGLLDLSPQPNGKLLMVFPGWPGIPRIELRDGKPSWLYLQQHVQEMRPVLHAAGISIMTVDCPTDQWGTRGPSPTACSDDYRATPQHADDVRALMAEARQAAAVQQMYVMGHSYEAVSSHWLAIRLGSELAGSVHSATQSVPGGGPFTRYAYTVAGIQPSQLPASSIYLHHREDLCRFTPYDFAKRQAIHGLMTVVGGNRWSDPCGKASYHSYSERSTEVGHALVKWINDGVITPLIKAQGE